MEHHYAVSKTKPFEAHCLSTVMWADWVWRLESKLREEHPVWSLSDYSHPSRLVLHTLCLSWHVFRCVGSRYAFP